MRKAIIVLFALTALLIISGCSDSKEQLYKDQCDVKLANQTISVQERVLENFYIKGQTEALIGVAQIAIDKGSVELYLGDQIVVLTLDRVGTVAPVLDNVVDIQ